MFDPYHNGWVFRRRSKPPNHYRLLALSLFESDPEVIDAAANRQMAYLQTCATGTGPQYSFARLLNEVAGVAAACSIQARRQITTPNSRRPSDQSVEPLTDQSIRDTSARRLDRILIAIQLTSWLRIVPLAGHLLQAGGSKPLGPPWVKRRTDDLLAFLNPSRSSSRRLAAEKTVWSGSHRRRSESRE